MPSADTFIARPKSAMFDARSSSTQDAELPSSGVRALGVFLAAAALAWIGYTISQGKYYTPRSPLGFSLGVAGTVMMLALLTYPLRKRARLMQGWGPLKYWLRAHMWLGILGPTLVLFHSAFHIRSTNAAVALFSMLFVVASGIIGRFVYTRIHHGLYGRRVTLDKLKQQWLFHADEAHSRFHFCPEAAEEIRYFEYAALERAYPFPANLLSFMGLGLRRQWSAFRCKAYLRRTMRTESTPSRRQNASLALTLLSPYLREVQRVAQFTAYERMFSLWHVLHVPLIVLLAVSTAFHVIAVYMY